MYLKSIEYLVTEKQDHKENLVYCNDSSNLKWNFELERFKKDQVFCPMCEIWHINNTLCQRND